MPRIITTGVRDAKNMDALKYNGQKRGFVFSGTTLPTTLEVGILDDEGNFALIAGGAVTVLPTDFIVDAIPTAGLVMNVTGGSPDLNVSVFDAGPLIQ